MSDDGIDKMSRLRVFVRNGGKVYEELIKKKKISCQKEMFNYSLRQKQNGYFFVYVVASK